MPRHVRDLLADHEAELISRLKSLREQIIPLERELAEVRKARSAVTLVDYGPEQVSIQFPMAGQSAEKKPDYSVQQSPYARLTIKELVRKALAEHFQRGATANELLSFFSDVYGRTEVQRTSLSPQLSRLKEDGKVILIGKKWLLPMAHERAIEASPSTIRKAAADP